MKAVTTTLKTTLWPFKDIRKEVEEELQRKVKSEKILAKAQKKAQRKEKKKKKSETKSDGESAAATALKGRWGGGGNNKYAVIDDDDVYTAPPPPESLSSRPSLNWQASYATNKMRDLRHSGAIQDIDHAEANSGRCRPKCTWCC